MSSKELRKWRESWGMTQKQAAAYLNYSLRQYQRFEEGQSPVPPRLQKYISLVGSGPA